ncbi:MAG: COQ9 family protein [Rickettsiales bacterium]
MSKTITELQQTLLAHTLPHVAFDGWSAAALEHGAASAGLRHVEIMRAFPNGADGCLEAFMQQLDAQMVTALSNAPLDTMKLPEKVATAIMARFEAAAPHREAVRKAVTHYAFPLHADQGMKRLYRTTDAIWRAIGDHPTDFSFYTKRLSLAMIYSSTLLFWLNDDSEGFAETRAFLQRRLGDLMRFHRFRQSITDRFTPRQQEG